MYLMGAADNRGQREGGAVAHREGGRQHSLHSVMVELRASSPWYPRHHTQRTCAQLSASSRSREGSHGNVSPAVTLEGLSGNWAF